MSWTRLDLVVSHCRTRPLGDRRYTMHHHLNHFALFVSFIPPFNIFSVLFDFLLSDKENVKVSLLAARACNRQKKGRGVVRVPGKRRDYYLAQKLGVGPCISLGEFPNISESGGGGCLSRHRCLTGILQSISSLHTLL